MKYNRFLKRIYFGLVVCFALGSFGYLHFNNHQHSYTPKVHATKTNLLHTSRPHRYRVYSHHYFSVENRDLYQLDMFENRLARDTNNVYEQRFNGTHPIYHKFHDHNYWGIFKDQPVPANYKGSHMNHQTYYAIQHRVLRSHGVFSGFNFKHHKHNTYSEV